MSFCGLFFVRNRRALQGLSDAPYHIMGRHALCARGVRADGGAMACAFGHLRNAAALRNQLTQAGMLAPDAQSDPSALTLAAYRMWGESYPAHLEGPVSTVLIDQDAQRLVLSRDRMGEKILFYAVRGCSVAFADHPAPLLDSGVATRAVNREGWCEVFALGPARTPGRTPLRDVMSLQPGCALVADAYGHAIHRYFELSAHPHEHDEATTVRTVRELIEQAVDDIMPLEPACMLSGGLDSTVLAALMSKRMGRPLSTWSVDYTDSARFFTGNNFQIERDAPYIEQANALFGADAHMVTLTSDQLCDGLDKAMELRGFPGMGDIDSSLMLFTHAIADERRFVVSGECSDEVFGGYPWFNREELITAEGFPWSGSMQLRESVLRASVREKLGLSRYACMRYHESACSLPRLSSDGAREALLRQLHGLCFEWFMPNLQERAVCMCADTDLGVLTPFADERLAQYVYNVPWSMKRMGGVEKGLLRAAAADLLPEQLLMRKKSPYPKTHHPRYAQLMRERMRRILSDKASPILDLIDAQAVTALVESPLDAAATPWFGQLMSGPQLLAYLVQVNQWMLRYRIDIDL